MRLTKAHKISMLTLAGYVPMVRCDGTNDMRITNIDKMMVLARNSDDKPRDWAYEIVHMGSYKLYYIQSNWDHMDVSTIPPHLIHLAINQEN